MSVTRRVSKTGMTRVEGENSSLRHYLARLHRKTLCYSKSVDMLYKSVRLLIYSLKAVAAFKLYVKKNQSLVGRPARPEYTI